MSRSTRRNVIVSIITVLMVAVSSVCVIGNWGSIKNWFGKDRNASQVEEVETSLKKTEDGVYLLDSANAMNEMKRLVENNIVTDGKFRLTSDVVLDETWEPISVFSGSFDGGGRQIIIAGANAENEKTGEVLQDETMVKSASLNTNDGSEVVDYKKGWCGWGSTFSYVFYGHMFSYAYNGYIKNAFVTVGKNALVDYDTRIKEVSPEGKLTGEDFNIDQSHARAIVGGLIGYAYNVDILNSVVQFTESIQVGRKGDISGVEFGGLVGHASCCNFEYCLVDYNDKKITPFGGIASDSVLYCGTLYSDFSGGSGVTIPLGSGKSTTYNCVALNCTNDTFKKDTAELGSIDYLNAQLRVHDESNRNPFDGDKYGSNDKEIKYCTGTTGVNGEFKQKSMNKQKYTNIASWKGSYIDDVWYQKDGWYFDDGTKTNGIGVMPIHCVFGYVNIYNIYQTGGNSSAPKSPLSHRTGKSVKDDTNGQGITFIYYQDKVPTYNKLEDQLEQDKKDAVGRIFDLLSFGPLEKGDSRYEFSSFGYLDDSERSVRYKGITTDKDKNKKVYEFAYGSTDLVCMWTKTALKDSEIVLKVNIEGNSETIRTITDSDDTITLKNYMSSDKLCWSVNKTIYEMSLANGATGSDPYKFVYSGMWNINEDTNRKGYFNGNLVYNVLKDIPESFLLNAALKGYLTCSTEGEFNDFQIALHGANGGYLDKNEKYLDLDRLSGSKYTLQQIMDALESLDNEDGGSRIRSLSKPGYTLVGWSFSNGAGVVKGSTSQSSFNIDKQEFYYIDYEAEWHPNGGLGVSAIKTIIGFNSYGKVDLYPVYVPNEIQVVYLDPNPEHAQTVNGVTYYTKHMQATGSNEDYTPMGCPSKVYYGVEFSIGSIYWNATTYSKYVINTITAAGVTLKSDDGGVSWYNAGTGLMSCGGNIKVIDSSIRTLYVLPVSSDIYTVGYLDVFVPNNNRTTYKYEKTVEVRYGFESSGDYVLYNLNDNFPLSDYYTNDAYHAVGWAADRVGKCGETNYSVGSYTISTTGIDHISGRSGRGCVFENTNMTTTLSFCHPFNVFGNYDQYNSNWKIYLVLEKTEFNISYYLGDNAKCQFISTQTYTIDDTQITNSATYTGPAYDFINIPTTTIRAITGNVPSSFNIAIQPVGTPNTWGANSGLQMQIYGSSRFYTLNRDMAVPNYVQNRYGDINVFIDLQSLNASCSLTIEYNVKDKPIRGNSGGVNTWMQAAALEVYLNGRNNSGNVYDGGKNSPWSVSLNEATQILTITYTKGTYFENDGYWFKYNWLTPTDIFGSNLAYGKVNGYSFNGYNVSGIESSYIAVEKDNNGFIEWHQYGSGLSSIWSFINTGIKGFSASMPKLTANFDVPSYDVEYYYTTEHGNLDKRVTGGVYGSAQYNTCAVGTILSLPAVPTYIDSYKVASGWYFYGNNGETDGGLAVKDADNKYIEYTAISLTSRLTSVDGKIKLYLLLEPYYTITYVDYDNNKISDSNLQEPDGVSSYSTHYYSTDAGIRLPNYYRRDAQIPYTTWQIIGSSEGNINTNISVDGGYWANKIGLTENLTIKACKEPSANIYIYLDLNGGDFIDDSYGKTLNTSMINPLLGVYTEGDNYWDDLQKVSTINTGTTPWWVEPKRSGYTFDGWKYGDTKVTDENAIVDSCSYMILVAQWNVYEYNYIDFYRCSDIVEGVIQYTRDRSQYNITSSITIPDYDKDWMVPENQKFKCWEIHSIDPDFTNWTTGDYKPGQIFDGMYGNVSFYPVFVNKEFTITLKRHDNSDFATIWYDATDEFVQLPTSGYSTDGSYMFGKDINNNIYYWEYDPKDNPGAASWTGTASCFAEKIIIAEAGREGDVVLKALVTYNNFTLTIDTNGGTLATSPDIVDNKISYTVLDTITCEQAEGCKYLPIPTKVNAVFAGWNVDVIDNSGLQNWVVPNSEGDATLYPTTFYEYSAAFTGKFGNVKLTAVYTNNPTITVSSNIPNDYPASANETGTYGFDWNYDDTKWDGNLTELKTNAYSNGTNIKDVVKNINPTMNGYTFCGWYTDANCTTALNSDVALDGDITLYAKWTINTYTFRLVPGNGEFTSSWLNGNGQSWGKIYNSDKTKVLYYIKTVNFGDAYMNLPTERTNIKYIGYNLTGWSWDSEGTQPFESSGYVGDRDYGKEEVKVDFGLINNSYAAYIDDNGNSTYTVINIYAIWEDLMYTLTLDMNTPDAVSFDASNLPQYSKGNNTFPSYTEDGDGHSNCLVKIREGVIYPIYLTNPSRIGYSFDGWYTEATGGNRVLTSQAELMDGDITLYAHWAIKSYAITAHLGTATAWGNTYSWRRVDDNTYRLLVDYGVTPTNLPVVSKTGYEFQYWYMGDNQEIKLSGDNKFKMPANDVEIYPQFKLEGNYTITYYGIEAATENKTVNVDGNPSSYNVTSGDIYLNSFTKNGYNFVKWQRTDVNPAEDVTGVAISHGSTGAREFTAIWQIIEYNINYNLNGGTVSETNPASYTIEDNITLINPTRTGYDFVGWTGTGLSGNTMEVTISTGSTGDRTYTANWEPISYTLKYWAKDIDGVDYEYTAQQVQWNVKSANVSLLTYEHFNKLYSYKLLGWKLKDASAWEETKDTTNHTITYVNNTKVLKFNCDDTNTYLTSLICGESCADVELEGEWTSLNYTITYLNSVGTDIVATSSYTYGSLTLPKQIPEDAEIPTYSNIASWKVKSVSNPYSWLVDGESWIVDNAYNTNTSISPCYGDVELRMSNATSYDVVFNLDDGKNGKVIADESCDYVVKDNKITISYNNYGNQDIDIINNISAKLTRNGYKQLIGWRLSNESDWDATFTSNTITYTLQSDSTSKVQFKYETIDGTKYLTKFISNLSNANCELVATWVECEYNVEFYNENNIKLTGSDYVGVKFTINSTEIALPSYSQSGYNFEGWKITEQIGNFVLFNEANNSSKYTTIPSGSYGNNSGDNSLPIKFYPYLVAKVYTVSFYETAADSSKYTALTITFTVEDTVEMSVVTEPDRVGYTFKGWKLKTPASEGNTINLTKNGEYVISINPGTNQSVELVADWELVTYSISYKKIYERNGAETTLTYDAIYNSYNIETQEFDLPTLYTEVGYNSVGWKLYNCDEGCAWDALEGQLIDGSVFNGKYGNITLAVYLEEITYTVTYLDNNGAVITDKTAYYTITSSNFVDENGNPRPNLETFALSHYVFLGWKLESVNNSYTNSVEEFKSNFNIDGQYVTSFKFNTSYGNFILKAYVTVEEYTITYISGYKNGASNISEEFILDTQLYNYTETVTLATSFDGFPNITQWDVRGYIDADKNYYKNGDDYDLTKGNWGNILKTNESCSGKYGNVVLYTTVTPIPFTITLDTDGGSINNYQLTDATYNKNEETITITYNVRTPEFYLPNVEMERRGYTFRGWMVEGDNEKYNSSTYPKLTTLNYILALNSKDNNYYITGIYKRSRGNVILKAIWSENSYNLVLNGNGGMDGSDTSKDNVLQYTDEYTLQNTFTRSGYVFIGWAVQNYNDTLAYAKVKVVDGVAQLDSNEGIDGIYNRYNDQSVSNLFDGSTMSWVNYILADNSKVTKLAHGNDISETVVIYNVYAVWAPIYSVIVKAEGGDIYMNSTKQELSEFSTSNNYWAGYTLPSINEDNVFNIPSANDNNYYLYREGYYIEGWSIQVDDSSINVNGENASLPGGIRMTTDASQPNNWLVGAIGDMVACGSNLQYLQGNITVSPVWKALTFDIIFKTAGEEGYKNGYNQEVVTKQFTYGSSYIMVTKPSASSSIDVYITDIKGYGIICAKPYRDGEVENITITVSGIWNYKTIQYKKYSSVQEDGVKWYIEIEGYYNPNLYRVKLNLDLPYDVEPTINGRDFTLTEIAVGALDAKYAPLEANYTNRQYKLYKAAGQYYIYLLQDELISNTDDSLTNLPIFTIPYYDLQYYYVINNLEDGYMYQIADEIKIEAVGGNNADKTPSDWKYEYHDTNEDLIDPFTLTATWYRDQINVQIDNILDGQNSGNGYIVVTETEKVINNDNDFVSCLIIYEYNSNSQSYEYMTYKFANNINFAVNAGFNYQILSSYNDAVLASKNIVKYAGNTISILAGNNISLKAYDQLTDHSIDNFVGYRFKQYNHELQSKNTWTYISELDENQNAEVTISLSNYHYDEENYNTNYYSDQDLLIVKVEFERIKYTLHYDTESAKGSIRLTYKSYNSVGATHTLSDIVVNSEDEIKSIVYVNLGYDLSDWSLNTGSAVISRGSKLQLTQIVNPGFLRETIYLNKAYSNDAEQTIGIMSANLECIEFAINVKVRDISRTDNSIINNYILSEDSDKLFRIYNGDIINTNEVYTITINQLYTIVMASKLAGDASVYYYFDGNMYAISRLYIGPNDKTSVRSLETKFDYPSVQLPNINMNVNYGLLNNTVIFKDNEPVYASNRVLNFYVEVAPLATITFNYIASKNEINSGERSFMANSTLVANGVSGADMQVMLDDNKYYGYVNQDIRFEFIADNRYYELARITFDNGEIIEVVAGSNYVFTGLQADCEATIELVLKTYDLDAKFVYNGTTYDFDDGNEITTLSGTHILGAYSITKVDKPNRPSNIYYCDDQMNINCEIADALKGDYVIEVTINGIIVYSKTNTYLASFNGKDMLIIINIKAIESNVVIQSNIGNEVASEIVVMVNSTDAKYVQSRNNVEITNTFVLQNEDKLSVYIKPYIGYRFTNVCVGANYPSTNAEISVTTVELDYGEYNGYWLFELFGSSSELGLYSTGKHGTYTLMFEIVPINIHLEYYTDRPYDFDDGFKPTTGFTYSSDGAIKLGAQITLIPGDIEEGYRFTGYSYKDNLANKRNSKAVRLDETFEITDEILNNLVLSEDESELIFTVYVNFIEQSKVNVYLIGEKDLILYDISDKDGNAISLDTYYDYGTVLNIAVGSTDQDHYIVEVSMIYGPYTTTIRPDVSWHLLKNVDYTNKGDVEDEYHVSQMTFKWTLDYNVDVNIKLTPELYYTQLVELAQSEVESDPNEYNSIKLETSVYSNIPNVTYRVEGDCSYNTQMTITILVEQPTDINKEYYALDKIILNGVEINIPDAQDIILGNKPCLKYEISYSLSGAELPTEIELILGYKAMYHVGVN